MILSYLDDNHIIDPNNKKAINALVKKRNPNFTGEVILEDLSKLGSKKQPKSEAELGIRTLYKRVGFTQNIYKSYMKEDYNGKGVMKFYAERGKSQVLNGSIEHRTIKDENGQTIIDKHYYPVKDTDPEYNPDKHGFFFGYNTTQYDLTILAHFLAMQDFKTILNSDAHPNTKTNTLLNEDGNKADIFTATDLRNFNDELFTSEFKSSMPSRLKFDYEATLNQDFKRNQYNIRERKPRFNTPSADARQAWLYSGRFIDVAALNEKMFRVGLKRLLGMMGHQILEFEGLDNGKLPTSTKEMEEMYGPGTTIEDVVHELIAYNVSDVVNLQYLFENQFYQNNFDLKRQLLTDYPETIYNKHEDEYRADFTGDASKDYQNVHFRRLMIDSTSTRFIEKVIAPYNKMTDQPVVSFVYPSEDEAIRLSKETGRDIKPVDVLDETRSWFEEKVAKPGTEAHDDFMQVYNFYDGIRGKNFNESSHYVETYQAEIQEEEYRIQYVNNHKDQFEGAVKYLKAFVHQSPEKQKGIIDELERFNVIADVLKVDSDDAKPLYQKLYDDEYRYGMISMIQQEIDEMYAEGLEHKYEVKDNTHIKKLMQTYNTNLFYYLPSDDKDPEKSTCLANFSIGGIHGNEVDLNKYNQAVNEWKVKQKELEYVKDLFDGDAMMAINGETRITNIHGEPQKIRDFMKSGSTKKSAEWREYEKPSLWKSKDNQMKLHDKYAYVSVGKSFHEDFASYYPLLLTRMSVFKNKFWGEGVDPYFALFEKRFEMKKRAKDMSLSPEERDKANIIQNAMKLLLNAATGAADASFDNNIRMNNAIISMRIIGQLFAWRIGQAQTLAGARVPSTNTDGLYTMDLDEETNARTLEETVQDMHIEIEPEPLDRFVSKDSNNRLEILNDDIVDSKGGTLNSYEGPKPTQSLDHPSAVDRALAYYLKDHKGDPSNSPFDEDLARNCYAAIIDENKDKPEEILRHFQWILSSSAGTIRHIFFQNKNLHTGKITNEAVQQYNRVFLTKPDGNNIKTPFLAIRRKVTPAMAQKRKRENLPVQQHNKQAREILIKNNVDFNEFEARDEAQIQKAKNMNEDQNVTVYNKSLYELSNKECWDLIKKLDVTSYINLLRNSVENSWSNVA